ncbi:MAG: GreA/GreB family elongation factor [Myxococcaceae bacterium]
MSKAFTKEDGAEQAPLARAAAQGRRLLTREGHARCVEELERLKEKERPALLADASATNRMRLQQLDARLLELTRLLEAAEVVEPGPDGGPATFGAWVTTEDEDGQRTTVRLVGPDEADPRQGLLSTASPLGRALLGRRPGDSTVVERPRGPAELKVVAVHSRR